MNTKNPLLTEEQKKERTLKQRTTLQFGVSVMQTMELLKYNLINLEELTQTIDQIAKEYGYITRTNKD